MKNAKARNHRKVTETITQMVSGIAFFEVAHDILQFFLPKTHFFFLPVVSILRKMPTFAANNKSQLHHANKL